MTPPINIDGTQITGASIDGSEVQAITVDGTEVFASASIPDNSMFQSPIYQWSATAGLSASDGETANNWTEQLSNIGDATVDDTPIFRANQDGRQAIEYGSGDGHDWLSNSLLPTGGSAQFSVAVTHYTTTNAAFQALTGFGNSDGIWCELANNGKYSVRLDGANDVRGGSYPTEQWDTTGFSFDQGNITVYGGGSNLASATRSVAPSDADHSHGYEAAFNQNSLQGFISGIIYSDAVESDQAFSEYHNDRTP